MSEHKLDAEMPTLRDSFGPRISREIKLGGKVLRTITLHQPSNDRLTAIMRQEPATLRTPAEGATFQILGIQLSPPHSPEEAERIIQAVPVLTGANGLSVEQVDCYDPENMISWQELHASRADEAGPWTSEAASGLLNAVHVALCHEVLAPHDEEQQLPPA